MNTKTLLWFTACLVLLGVVIYQLVLLELPVVQAQCTVTDPSGCESLIASNSARWQDAQTIKARAEQENAIYRSILSLHWSGETKK